MGSREADSAKSAIDSVARALMGPQPDVLYHYASSEGFRSIISSASVWLSALSLSNDSMEGLWVTKIFEDLCNENQLPKYQIERLMSALSYFPDTVLGLGFCLSERGDMLSQWRGYADDGYGFCIGYRRSALEQLSGRLESNDETAVSLSRVIYSEASQRERISRVYDECKIHIDEGAYSFPELAIGLFGGDSPDKEKKIAERDEALRKLSAAQIKILIYLFVFKNPVFAEEAEWRLISYHFDNVDKVSYRSGRDRLLPYQALKLGDLAPDAIAEIIIGPKNITPIRLVAAFLDKFGVKNVAVTRSSATYR